MPNLDDYAELIYIGPASEYWITFGGHGHSQQPSGLPAGTLGKLHGGVFGRVHATHH